MKTPVSDEHAAQTMQRYEKHIGPMREAARAQGYALAVHGSLRRDIDLIAAPWTLDASDPETLIEAIRAACGGFVKRDPDRADKNNYLHHSPDPKPHGRLGFQIIPGDGATYFDVSVLPCAESHAHAEEIEAAKRHGYAEALSDRVIAEADRDRLHAENDHATAERTRLENALHGLARDWMQLETKVKDAHAERNRFDRERKESNARARELQRRVEELENRGSCDLT